MTFSGLAALTQWIYTRGVLHRALFDASQFVLNACAGAYVFRLGSELLPGRAGTVVAAIGVLGLVAFTVPPVLVLLSMREYLERTRAAVDEVRAANDELTRVNAELAERNRDLHDLFEFAGGLASHSHDRGQLVAFAESWLGQTSGGTARICVGIGSGGTALIAGGKQVGSLSLIHGTRSTRTAGTGCAMPWCRSWRRRSRARHSSSRSGERTSRRSPPSHERSRRRTPPPVTTRSGSPRSPSRSPDGSRDRTAEPRARRRPRLPGRSGRHGDPAPCSDRPRGGRAGRDHVRPAPP